MFFKINSVIFPARINEINVLKTLPFLYTSGFVLICHRILKHFRIEGAPLAVCMSFICFHPQLLFLAIQINNDALMMVLFAASVYLPYRWVNSLARAIVNSLVFCGAIGWAVFLSYIGLGLSVDTPSLGNLVNTGRALMSAPSLRYQLIFPAAVLSVITICFYIVGNAFADAADPRNHV